MKIFIGLVFIFLLIPGVSKPQVFEEKDGIVSIEAEHFFNQEKDSIRKWYKISRTSNLILADADTTHYESASGNTYLENLPDTRTNHGDSLKQGENFSNIPGEIAVLNFQVYFNEIGKYYVWVRAFSTGSEDNGIHVGLDGEWPESGARMQWCEGKHNWTWESKQRTSKNHCGEEQLIFLEIKEAGIHTITFSMREDGFEFDKFVLSKKYEMPEGAGPKESPKIPAKNNN